MIRIETYMCIQKNLIIHKQHNNNTWHQQHRPMSLVEKIKRACFVFEITFGLYGLPEKRLIYIVLLISCYALYRGFLVLGPKVREFGSDV
ncbi:hypothetical protein SeMB42_g02869 [Synchytrium endobioticum]|uniref:Uncharacterized protein n=1 Tax=Synchytrium endobioticum TaxID=286115 RepID=A0A507DAR8_9FUNG|nr:hypothetical protein SeMB42_g02869 [Synchytrium endobioticum]